MSDRQEIAAIYAVMANMQAAWNTGDFAGYMKGFSNPDVIFVSRGQIQSDWQATLDHYERDYGGGPGRRGHLEFSDMNVVVLAPGVAQLVGTYTLVRDTGTQTGINTRILHKRAETGWVITLNHVSART
jgi:uncharacterized protein (TIGR02246 family)